MAREKRRFCLQITCNNGICPNLILWLITTLRNAYITALLQHQLEKQGSNCGCIQILIHSKFVVIIRYVFRQFK